MVAVVLLGGWVEVGPKDARFVLWTPNIVLLSVSHCRPTRLSSVVKKWPFLFVFLLTQSPKSFLYHPPFHLPLHDVAMKKKKKK